MKMIYFCSIAYGDHNEICDILFKLGIYFNLKSMEDPFKGFKLWIFESNVDEVNESFIANDLTNLLWFQHHEN